MSSIRAYSASGTWSYAPLECVVSDDGVGRVCPVLGIKKPTYQGQMGRLVALATFKKPRYVDRNSYRRLSAHWRQGFMVAHQSPCRIFSPIGSRASGFTKWTCLHGTSPPAASRRRPAAHIRTCTSDGLGSAGPCHPCRVSSWFPPSAFSIL